MRSAAAMIVSIEGNIGSGKSTVLSHLEYLYKHQNIDVVCYPEPVEEWQTCLENFYKDMTRWSFALQMKILLTYVKRKPRNHDKKLHLYERSCAASKNVFAQSLFNAGTLSEREWALYKCYYDSVAWQPDVIIYLRTDPEVCMTRLRGRDRKCETTLDFEYLQKLHFHYNNLAKYFDGKVIVVDTNDKSIIQVCAEVFDTLSSLRTNTPDNFDTAQQNTRDDAHTVCGPDGLHT